MTLTLSQPRSASRETFLLLLISCHIELRSTKNDHIMLNKINLFYICDNMYILCTLGLNSNGKNKICFVKVGQRCTTTSIILASKNIYSTLF